MEETLRDLYNRYVAAIHYYNSLPEDRPGRSVVALKLLSEAEFPRWWEMISQYREIQARWLERFADPAAALIHEQQRISAELAGIQRRRAAA